MHLSPAEHAPFPSNCFPTGSSIRTSSCPRRAQACFCRIDRTLSIIPFTGFSFIIYRLRRLLFPCCFSFLLFHLHELGSLLQSIYYSCKENAACLFGQAAVSAFITAFISGYPAARIKAPGSRHPLDPVLLRHTQISPSACFAVGIIVPWRSNRRYVFFILFVYICSIAFPFRTCGFGPFFLELTITYQVQLVIILVV